MAIITISNFAQNYIGIIERDEHNKKTIKIVKDFKPYFYVPSINGEYKSIYGKRLKKIYCSIPAEVKRIRDRYYETFESDVNFENRYLIDKVPTPIAKVKIRKLFFDIETYLSVDWQNTPEPILSIAYYDSYEKELCCFVWHSDKHYHKTNNVIYFNNERDMLRCFIEKIKQLQPDMFIGWNLIFDLGYFYNRAKKLGLDVESISPFNTIFVDAEYGDVNFAGIITFDLMTAYKKVKGTEIESYSLQNIANLELGKSKLKVDFKNDYKNNLSKFIKYNLYDVQLLLDLENHLKLIDYFDELRRLVGCTWSTLAYNSNIIDVFFLRKAKEKGIVLPRKRMLKTRQSYTGAFVKQPKAGLFKNVLLLDLKRLYPSIILQFHISNELISPDGEIEGFNGFRFKNQKGFMTDVILEILRLRDKYKTEMKQKEPYSKEWNSLNNRQKGLKFLANSIYGYLGFSNSRFYKEGLAENITLFGREIINFSEQKVKEKFGYEILACDTDSLFVKLPDDFTKEECIKKGYEIIDFLNNEVYNELVRIHGCAKNDWLEMEFEAWLKSIVFVGIKKKYAYYEGWRDGNDTDKIGFKGFAVRRSNQSKLTKQLQKEIFEVILKNTTSEFPIENVKRIINKYKTKIFNDEFEIEDILLTNKLNRNPSSYKSLPIHVRAILNGKEQLNQQIVPGMKIKWAYINSGNQVIGVEESNEHLIKNFKINKQKMFELMTENLIQKLCSAFNLRNTDFFADQTGISRWLK